MRIVNSLRSEARFFCSLLDDGYKAALRTAYQNVQAAFTIALFAIVSSVVAWASGADIDLLDSIAVGRTSVGLAALGAVASLRAYYMNRGDKGATYR
jgi:formylmethanofuran dehydrogenase subunit E-like metal-binding protein